MSECGDGMDPVSEDNLQDLERGLMLVAYGADIAVRLARIHSHPERDGPRGTLVVALRGSNPVFVRCAFVEHGSALRCEVVHGDYPLEADESLAVAEAEEALKRLGYWRDENGCALAIFEMSGDSGDWGGAAVGILNPLISVFGAGPDSEIDIIAPLESEPDEDAMKLMLAGQF